MVGAKVVDVCVSQRKGIAKRAVSEIVLRKDHGIEGDAHAGFDHRQVSLLAVDDIDRMREKGLELSSGAFGENLVIAGLETDSLGVGSRLKIGDGELEISQIGKVCHDRCAIYHSTGDCIMPRKGLFAVVRRDGRVTRGDQVVVVSRVARARGRLPVIEKESR